MGFDLDDEELDATLRLHNLLNKKQQEEHKKLKELKLELKDLDKRYYMLNMKDHWDSEDYKYSDELIQKMGEIKKDIDKIEKK